jgi:hypothetical protein
MSGHLARGLLGFAALWAGFHFASHGPGYSAALVIVGLLLLRGCPMCWAATLIERLRRNRDVACRCTDGSGERDMNEGTLCNAFERIGRNEGISTMLAEYAEQPCRRERLLWNSAAAAERSGSPRRSRII